MDEYIEINYEDVKNDPKKYIGMECFNKSYKTSKIIICGIDGSNWIVIKSISDDCYNGLINIKIKNPDYKPEVKPETRDDIIKHLDGIIKLLKQA